MASGATGAYRFAVVFVRCTLCGVGWCVSFCCGFHALPRSVVLFSASHLFLPPSVPHPVSLSHGRCKCAAVPSICVNATQAAKLPQAVFDVRSDYFLSLCCRAGLRLLMFVLPSPFFVQCHNATELTVKIGDLTFKIGTHFVSFCSSSSMPFSDNALLILVVCLPSVLLQTRILARRRSASTNSGGSRLPPTLTSLLHLSIPSRQELLLQMKP